MCVCEYLPVLCMCMCVSGDVERGLACLDAPSEKVEPAFISSAPHPSRAQLWSPHQISSRIWAPEGLDAIGCSRPLASHCPAGTHPIALRKHPVPASRFLFRSSSTRAGLRRGEKGRPGTCTCCWWERKEDPYLCGCSASFFIIS